MSLTTSSEFAGRVIECSQCERVVPVPGWKAPEGAVCPPVFSPEIFSIEIKFACAGCDRALLADLRWGGEHFACPKCGTAAHVPEWFGSNPRLAKTGLPPQVHAAALSPEEIDFLNGDACIRPDLVAPG